DRRDRARGEVRGAALGGGGGRGGGGVRGEDDSGCGAAGDRWRPGFGDLRRFIFWIVLLASRRGDYYGFSSVDEIAAVATPALARLFDFATGLETGRYGCASRATSSALAACVGLPRKTTAAASLNGKTRGLPVSERNWLTTFCSAAEGVPAGK